MNTRFIFGALIVILGLSILFDLNIFRFIIPIILIWIGLQIILGKNFSQNLSEQTEIQEDTVKHKLFFSNSNHKVSSSNFLGGEIVGLFSKCELDVSQVQVKEKELEIQITSMFSSVCVKIPENWTVTSESIGILGKFDNKAIAGSVKKIITVRIKGITLLGEVIIIN